MWRKNKLISNASVYVIGNFIQRAAEFLLLPLWVRFLTPADYGITGTMSAYAGVLFVLMNLSLNSAVVRFYYDHVNDRETLKRNVTTISLFSLLLGFALLQLFSLIGNWAWERIAGPSIPFYPYVQLMLWIAYLRTWPQIPLGLYQAQQKPKKFLAMQYLISGSQIIMGFVFVMGLRWGAYGQIMSQLVAAIVAGVVAVVILFRSWFTWKLNWKFVKTALLFSLPLVPHALSAWALNAADRVILQRYVTITEVGLYNIGYSLGMVMQVLVYAINQSWSPYYYQLMAAGQETEKKIIAIVSVYLAGIGWICLLGTVFAGEIVRIFLPDKYFGGIPYIGPVLLGYFFQGLYFFAVTSVFYYKKTYVVPLLTGASAVFNIGLNILLIPRFGAIASAWITTLTYFLLLFPTLLVSRRYQIIHYPFAKFALVISVLVAGVLLFNQIATPLTPLIFLGKILFVGFYTLIAYLTLIKDHIPANLVWANLFRK